MDIIDTTIPMVKISKDFDKVVIFFMNFWRFGQTTTVWPKFAISAWTFRKLQMVFCGHIVAGVESPHDAHFLFVKGILVHASQMEA